MKFSVSISCDKRASSKTHLINDLVVSINEFLLEKNYGDGIEELLISFNIVRPPAGFGHLHKTFKPKFTGHKVLTNKFTGERIEIIKQFHYGINVQDDSYQEFILGSEERVRKIIAALILNSLSHLDSLPKKNIDFNKEEFLRDLRAFLADII